MAVATAGNAFPCLLPQFQHHTRNHCKRLKTPHVFQTQNRSIPSVQNVEYLEREFGGHGVHFSGIGQSCVLKLVVDNGSTATLMLPTALITSYKPQMWHGATLELLHTCVSEGEDGSGALVHGGISMDFHCASDDGAHPTWAPSSWKLHDVRGSPRNSVQVELKCKDSEELVEFKYLVTLHQDLLSSEVTVTNLKSATIYLTGSVISHLTVSTPDATYAAGLEGSDYFIKSPLTSHFSIIPPGFYGQERSPKSSQFLDQNLFQGLFSTWGGLDKERSGDNELKKTRSRASEEEMQGEEDDNFKHLTKKMSRIYTRAPRKFTILDRGRRNSVIVRRAGFDELYVFSPGSSYEWYGKYAYICTGPSARLKPIVLGPDGVWSGAQYLYNPNL